MRPLLYLSGTRINIKTRLFPYHANWNHEDTYLPTWKGKSKEKGKKGEEYREI